MATHSAWAPVLLSVLAALPLGAAAAQHPAQHPAQRPEPVHAQQGRQARWSKLTPQERERILRNYGEFQRVDPSLRQEHLARWRRLHELGGSGRGVIPAEIQRQLEGLEPAQRRELLREYFQHRLEELELRLERAGQAKARFGQPGAQPGMPLRGQGGPDQLGQRRARGLREWGTRLGLDAAQVEELENADEQTQIRRLSELRAQFLRGQVAQKGLPPGIAPEEFKTWQNLPPKEFLRRWDDARNLRQGAHGSKGPPFQLLRPDPAWFAELAQLEPAARRAEIERRVKQRLLSKWDTLPELGRQPLQPAERSELEALEGPSFRARALELLRDRLRKESDRR